MEAFKKAHPELFKPRSRIEQKKSFLFEVPQFYETGTKGLGFKKQYTFEDTYLVKGKYRVLLQDILAGLSNQELQVKHNYKTLNTLEVAIHRARKAVFDKVEQGQHLLKTKTQIKFKDFLDKRVFNYRQKEEEVFLVQVPKRYRLRYYNFAEDQIEALLKKARLVEHLMTGNVKTQWRFLLERPILVEHLKRKQTLLDFLNSFRWCDSAGILFKPTVDILLTNLEVSSEELDVIHEQ